jgi:hypothetical protein
MGSAARWQNRSLFDAFCFTFFPTASSRFVIMASTQAQMFQRTFRAPGRHWPRPRRPTIRPPPSIIRRRQAKHGKRQCCGYPVWILDVVPIVEVRLPPRSSVGVDGVIMLEIRPDLPGLAIPFTANSRQEAAGIGLSFDCERDHFRLWNRPSDRRCIAQCEVLASIFVSTKPLGPSNPTLMLEPRSLFPQ